ncbi:MAG: hypothetical protein WAM39_01665 [Bryobacteraceae bacterium]
MGVESNYAPRTHMISQRSRTVVLILGLALSAAGLYAKNKHPKPEPPAQDHIQVAAHIPVTGGTIVRFLTTQHYRRNYLYAEHESGKTVTLIDITNISRPAVLAEMSDPTGLSGGLVAVTGNAVLVATANHQTEEASPSPQTFRILSFADPLHPTVQQEFHGVTATARDDQRGLIFLANSDGIWILQQQFAMDPEFEKEWEHMMLDAR